MDFFKKTLLLGAITGALIFGASSVYASIDITAHTPPTGNPTFHYFGEFSYIISNPGPGGFCSVGSYNNCEFITTIPAQTHDDLGADYRLITGLESTGVRDDWYGYSRVSGGGPADGWNDDTPGLNSGIPYSWGIPTVLIDPSPSASNSLDFYYSIRSPGSLNIVTNVRGGDGSEKFNFVARKETDFDVQSYPGPIYFTLGGSITGNDSSGAIPVASGIYSISGSASGFSVVSSYCDNGPYFPNGGNSINSINVYFGKTTTCTFNFVKNGNLKIVVNTNGADGTFSFGYNYGSFKLVNQINQTIGYGATYCGSAFPPYVLGPLYNNNNIAPYFYGTFMDHWGSPSYFSCFNVSVPTLLNITTSQGTGSGQVEVLPDMAMSIASSLNVTSASCDEPYTYSPGYPTFGLTDVKVLPGQTTTCTINLNETGNLKIITKVDGGDGSTRYTLNGPSSQTVIIPTSNGTGSQTVAAISGKYTITGSSESSFPWLQNDVSCDQPASDTANNGVSLFIPPGQTVTCTFSYAVSYLQIITNARDGDGVFNYDISGPTTTKESVTTINGTNSTLIPVIPGSYAVAQLNPDDFAFDSVNCVSPVSSGGNPNLSSTGNGFANLTISTGQIAICSFNNTKIKNAASTSLRIIKNTVGDDGTFVYAIFPTPSILTITTVNGIGVGEITGINANVTYTASEGYTAGWSINYVSCDKSYSNASNGTYIGSVSNVTVVPGQTTTCTFTGTAPNIPDQTAIKIITNAVGGDDNFSYDISQAPLTPIVNTTGGVGATDAMPVAAGTNYTILQKAPNGWTLSSVYCIYRPSDTTGTPIQGATITNVTVASDASGKGLTTCLFTNVKNGTAGQTGIKIVVTTKNGEKAFNFTINGPVSSYVNIQTAGGTGNSDVVQVTPGNTYLVSYVKPVPEDDWSIDSATCDKTSVPATNGVQNITVTDGQVTTCTFKATQNNSPAQALPITQTGIKIITDAEGGDTDFKYTVNGNSFNPNIDILTKNGLGASPILQAAAGTTYTITEKIPSGWTLESYSCDNFPHFQQVANGVAITVDDGKIATCSFANVKDGALVQPGFKVIANAIGGDSAFNASVSSNGTITLLVISTVNGIGSKTIDGNPGEVFSGSEATPFPDGWIGLNSSCNSTLAANQIAICVLTYKKNTTPGYLQLITKTKGGDTTVTYSVTVSGGQSLVTVPITNGSGTSDAIGVGAGKTFPIIQQVPDGFVFTSAACDQSYRPAKNGVTDVVVLAGGTTTCTFNDTKKGDLRIAVETDGGDGIFGYTINSTGDQNTTTAESVTTSGGSGQTDLIEATPGALYTIAQDFSNSWISTSITCDQSSSPSIGTVTNITVLDGQTTTCTFKNTKRGAIQFAVETIGGDGAFTFDVSPTPATVTVETANSTGLSDLIPVDPGTYDVTETGGSGTLISAVCNGEGYTNENNNISGLDILPGQTVICTFKNMQDIPHPSGPQPKTLPQGNLVIIKNMLGGDRTFDYFVFKVGSTPPTEPTATITTTNGTGTIGLTVDPGQYVIFEKYNCKEFFADPTYNPYNCYINYYYYAGSSRPLYGSTNGVYDIVQTSPGFSNCNDSTSTKYAGSDQSTGLTNITVSDEKQTVCTFPSYVLPGPR